MGEPRKTAGDRREALVETTAALLVEQGLAMTRTRDVTARAGVGVGLLNHYFAWTDLRAIALGRALAQTVECVLPETPGDPGARLEVFLAASFAEATDPFWRLWIEAVDAAMTDPAVAQVTETAARHLHARLASCLRQGDAAGLWSCSDADGAALRILAAQDGFSGFVLCGVPRIARDEAEAQLRHVVALECGRPVRASAASGAPGP